MCYDTDPMALTFDTRKAFQKLLQSGLPEPAADGIVEVVEEATSPLVSSELGIRLRYPGEVVEYLASGHPSRCPSGKPPLKFQYELRLLE